MSIHPWGGGGFQEGWPKKRAKKKGLFILGGGFPGKAGHKRGLRRRHFLWGCSQGGLPNSEAGLGRKDLLGGFSWEGWPKKRAKWSSPKKRRLGRMHFFTQSADRRTPQHGGLRFWKKGYSGQIRPKRGAKKKGLCWTHLQTKGPPSKP